MDLNLLERGIAAVNPHWGIRRLAAKVALEQARLSTRAYDAARRDRRTDSWRATGGSANAELTPALSMITRRSRDMCRNNEWAVNFKRKAVAHMIGTGIMPRPASHEKTRRKEAAKDAWESFVENCDPEGLTDYYGIQARLAGEVVEGGAAFLRWYVRPPEFGLTVPLQCEVLEHDFLDTGRTEIKADGNVVIHGVEYDTFGRRVAYWLFPVHPGELNTITRRGSNFISERVPAGECDHVFRVDRPGQVTGVPWLAPSMLRLRDLADYEEAELVRKKIEACFTVFVRRDPTGLTGVAQAVDQGKDGNDRRLEKIAPGMIAYVDGANDIITATPATSSGAQEHTKRQLYAFAAGVGLTYEMASGDLSNVNYSSIREGKLDFWSVLDQWQLFMLVPQACRPAWRRVMRAASARGADVGGVRSEWTVPKRPWVDPLKDVKAEELELKLALELWREKVTARGYDPEQFVADYEEDRKKLEAAGFSFGSTPNEGAEDSDLDGESNGLAGNRVP